MKPRSQYTAQDLSRAAEGPAGPVREAPSSRRWQSECFPALFFFETDEHSIQYGKHLHAGLEIGWTLNNNCVLAHNNHVYQLNFGDAAVFAPYELHGGGALGDSPTRFASLHIPVTILELLADNRFPRPFTYSRLPPIKVVDGNIALRLYHEMTEVLPTITTAHEQLSYLNDLLNRLLASSSSIEIQYPEAHYHPAIRHLRSIMHSTFAEHIDFRQLAREVELHERYLISLFKTATGLPPHQFQIALRVEYARRMLEENFSLIDISSAAGFADQSHFSRHFKRSYGVPPGLFKKTMKPFYPGKDSGAGPVVPIA